MRPIAHTISRNPLGLAMCLLFLLTGMFCCFWWTKLQSFFFLNTYHASWLDNTMIFLTWIGDGIFSLLLATLFFGARKKVISVQIVLSFLFSGLLVQAGKYLWSAPRPRVLISKESYHNFIEGVTGTGWSSFPSGHTTSIFALLTVMLLNYPGKRISALLVVGAFLIGYSRIYLGQHFLEDVLAGAFLGICASVLVVFISERFVEARARKTGTEF